VIIKETYVVNDMEVGNVVEKEAPLPTQEVPVDGGGSTSLETPFLAAVVREIRIGVVQVCDHDD
jgi:hypothetical protein